MTLVENKIPYSETLPWPEGMAPMAVIDEDGALSEPHAQYAWLRHNYPVIAMHNEVGPDVWVVTRYDSVRAGLRAPKVYANQPGDTQPTYAFVSQWDAPNHSRLRQFYARAFNPKSIALVEDDVRERAITLIDRFVAAGGGDLIEELAVPLTLITIGSVAGLPTEDIPALKEYSEHMLLLQARARALPSSEDAEERSLEFLAYVAERLDVLHAEGSESVGGVIAKAWKNGEMTKEEAAQMTGFLFVGGHDTTTMLLGHLVRFMIEEPDLLERLRTDPEAPARAVEEAVRMRGAVHRATRYLKEEVVVDGVPIPQGELVRLVVAAANRDESVFDHPNEFDIDRDNSKHLGFGAGVHSCPGAPLARLQLRVALEEISRRVEKFEFHGADALEIQPGHSISLGPTRLMVRVTSLT